MSEFSFELARYVLGEGDETKLRALLTDGRLDPDRLLEDASLHGLGPAALLALDRLGLTGTVPESLHRRLIEQRTVSSMQTAFIEQTLGSLLDRLGESGVPAILLKGIWYAERFYDPPWLRSFGDVDLLVSENSWPTFLETLKREGYESGRDYEKYPPKLTNGDIPQHLSFRSPAGWMLDPALDLFKLGLRSPISELVWGLSVDAELLGRRVRALSPEMEILNICGHLHRHGFQRLIWFVDLALAIKKLRPDWPLVSDLAAEAGLGTSVYHSLKYLNVFLGAQVSQGVLETARPGRLGRLVFARYWPDDDLLAFKGKRDGPVVFRRQLLGGDLGANLILTGQVAGKSAYLWRKLVPPREFLRHKYGQGVQGRYVPLYAKRAIAAVTRKRS